MLSFREQHYGTRMPTGIAALLVGDIGGTNSNFGVFSDDGKKRTLLCSLHFKSQEVTDFNVLVEQVVTYLKERYSITVQHSCFAAAGIVPPTYDYCKPTNLSFVLKSSDICAKTGLTCAVIVNDFEVIGHGISHINPRSLVQVKSGKAQQKGHKAIVGAGTGLGKCMLVWYETRALYVPLPSEGGHADFPAQSQQEFDLITFIQKKEKRTSAVSWEDVLSGNGIGRIYAFFNSQNHGSQHNVQSAEVVRYPDDIFEARHIDKSSWRTFELYAHIYARCVKDYTLDTLASAGIYIAGGIATHNVPLFEQPCFIKEFLNCDKQREFLKQVPIYVIADYNVSLYGAVEYMLSNHMCG
ncbi:MAG: glucokinase [Candidatus Babeliales bacterium]